MPTRKLSVPSDEITHVTIENAEGEQETIVSTPEHPFYVEGLGWVEASALHPGITIWFANGTKGTVEDISNEGFEEPVTVYNFEVKDFHTYFVGESGVLVHNTCTQNNDSVVDIPTSNNDSDGKIFWGSWQDYDKVTVDGREYAIVGERMYTEHAVARMQPSGMRYTSESAGGRAGASRIIQAGQKDYGRSVSPNFVEDVINSGNIVSTPVVNGVQRQVFESGTVQVVTVQEGNIVVTIMTK